MRDESSEVAATTDEEPGLVKVFSFVEVPGGRGGLVGQLSRM